MADELTPDADAVEAAAPAPAAPPVTPEPGPGPWSADLAQYIEDENARLAADRYLREKVQPRITELEEGSAQARALWNDLLEDPQQTLTAVVADIYGDEVAQQMAGMFGYQDEEEAPVENNEAELPQHIQDMYEQFQADQAQKAYVAEVERIKGTYPTLEEEFFHPFVVSTQGDFDAALEGYKAWEARVQERYAPAPEAAPGAPAVVGTTGPGSAAPPVQKTYASLDEALEDTLAEMRTSAPSTVGSV